MKKGRKIVTTLSDGILHRLDYKTCPHCEISNEYDLWNEAATTLVNSIVHCKHGSVAVISECPKCFLSSWVHHNIDAMEWMFKEIAPEWIKPIKEEYEKRKLAAIRMWAASLCINCKHVKEPVCNTHTYRSCICGVGPAKLEECEKFVDIRKTLNGSSTRSSN
jgi:hypothetical protein